MLIYNIISIHTEWLKLWLFQWSCRMWEVSHKEGLDTAELRFSNCDAAENSWESLDCRELKPVNAKGNQPQMFVGRTDAEAEAPVFCAPDVKSQLIGEGSDARKNWRQEEKETTEREIVGWHHQLTGHEFESTPGDSEGQGGLMCCSLWGRKESDTT